jgi:hypothetical protein
MIKQENTENLTIENSSSVEKKLYISPKVTAHDVADLTQNGGGHAVDGFFGEAAS